MAARNVLVGEGEKCKVTDFGMARNVQQDDIYTKQSRVRVFVESQFYHLCKLYLKTNFLLLSIDFVLFSVKRVVCLLSGLLMKLCCMEHTQPKVTCKYYKTARFSKSSNSFVLGKIKQFYGLLQSVFIKEKLTMTVF